MPPQNSPGTLPGASPADAEGSALAPAFSPLYQQIKALIMQGLRAGEWRPGEAIPSEIELAARYRVSQGTVRKAIDELATENLLVRRQGKGTFVASHSEAQTSFRFLRLRNDEGHTEALERRFIDCRRLRAPADVARSLSLKTGDTVVQVRRMLSVRGAPVVLDEIWLPGAQFKGLTADRLSDYRGPMYAFFEAEFGVRMVRAEEKIKAVLADAETAALMQVSPGSPLLSVERLTFTYSDQAVEVRRGLYNTQSHYYRNELS
jgi:GntR family transcriptional regulator